VHGNDLRIPFPKYADWFDAFDALEEHLSNLPAK
jgi:hypothetical protein